MNSVMSHTIAALLTVENVRKAFPKPDGGELLVLEGVNLRLEPGQIVGLLGRSGSGKSTLLRLIAGLAEPSGGSLSFHGQPIAGPAAGIAMVFQSFALFPWLTVFENVALGLEALPRGYRSDRPRRLRVGLPARALGRHAPARWMRAGAGRAPRRPIDGRAVLGP